MLLLHVFHRPLLIQVLSVLILSFLFGHLKEEERQRRGENGEEKRMGRESERVSEQK